MCQCPSGCANSSCEVGLFKTNKVCSGASCVLTLDHFPILSGEGPGELLHWPQPDPLWAATRAHHETVHNPWTLISLHTQQHLLRGDTESRSLCCCTRNTTLKTSSHRISFWKPWALLSSTAFSFNDPFVLSWPLV